MESIVQLARFRQNTEAELVRTYLESNGITCFLTDSLSNQMFGGFIDMEGVRLDVRRKDLPRALELMKEGGFDEYVVEMS
ncbi:MAG: DUF2007 domain-containing protein [Bacteroidales bacterium]